MSAEHLPGRAVGAVTQDVKVLLDNSRTLTAVDRTAAIVAEAIDRSTAAHHTRRLREAWLGFSQASRRGVIGTVLLTGVATHVGMTAWQELPAGWLWLLVPALAAGAGALCLLASDRPAA